MKDLLLIFLSLLQASETPPSSRGLALGFDSPDIGFGDFLLQVPDIDADGSEDIAVGAPWANDKAGAVYLISGASFKLIRSIFGPPTGRTFGSHIAFIRGSKPRESCLVVSSAYTASTPGFVYVVSCASGAMVRTHTPAPCSFLTRPVANLGDLNNDTYEDYGISFTTGKGCPERLGLRAYSGRDGSSIYEASVGTSGLSAVQSVRKVGDLDRDGFSDFAIGCFDARDSMLIGTVYLFSGKGGALIDALTQPGESGFGASVDVIRDIDNDGCDDLVVGSPMRSGSDSSRQRVGTTRILSGRLRTTVSVIQGKHPSFGTLVRCMEDIDADGYQDIVVSAPEETAKSYSEGCVVVFSSKSNKELVRCEGRTSAEYLGVSLALVDVASGAGSKSSSEADAVVAHGRTFLLVGNRPAGNLGMEPMVLPRTIRVFQVPGGAWIGSITQEAVIGSAR